MLESPFNDIWSGRDESFSLSYKNINFWKANGIDLKFYEFS